MYQLDVEARRQAESDRRAGALAAALNEYHEQGALPAWVRPQPSWVRVTSDVEPPRILREEDEEGWQGSDNLWDDQYAANVLQRVPVMAVMSSHGRARYIEAIESFVAWTLDTINPAWRVQSRRGSRYGENNLYEWRDQLGRIVAGVAPHLPTDEFLQRLLQPIRSQPDEIAFGLLAPFTVSLVCRDVLDARELRDDTLCILTAVLERTLEDENLRRSPHNDGRISGYHLPELIKSLLFVVVEHASGAIRYANGNWEDLDRVLPLIDRLVLAAGWHPFVAHQFVILCERSGAAYPTMTFADQVLSQVIDGHLPDCWKGTVLPARIAGLIQAHADRQRPLPSDLARRMLQVLDALVDLGDRRSAALQQSESFRGVRIRVTEAEASP